MEPIRTQLKGFALNGDVQGFLKRFREVKQAREDVLNCVVPGQPVGKGRPRVTRTGHAFTPKKTRAWEASASTLFRIANKSKRQIEGPVGLWVEAVAARPKRLQRRNDPVDRIWRQSRPDGDNVLKIVADALEKAGVIQNDSQIVEWFCRSYYAAKGEEPCVAVRVFRLNGVDE